MFIQINKVLGMQNFQYLLKLRQSLCIIHYALCNFIPGTERWTKKLMQASKIYQDKGYGVKKEQTYHLVSQTHKFSLAFFTVFQRHF